MHYLFLVCFYFGGGRRGVRGKVNDLVFEYANKNERKIMKNLVIALSFISVLISESQTFVCRYGFGMEYTPSLIIMGSE